MRPKLEVPGGSVENLSAKNLRNQEPYIGNGPMKAQTMRAVLLPSQAYSERIMAIFGERWDMLGIQDSCTPIYKLATHNLSISNING